MTSLSLQQGDGGTSSQQGEIEVTPNYKDYVGERNLKLRSATPLGSVDTPYDLSTKGGKESRHTANCYVISAPGSYCIPLVYGNAIKGGITNEPAYKTTNTGQKILSHFVDHEGNPIHSPYINVQNSSAPAESANIVWTDASSTPVTNLTLTGSGANSYVKFDVPANKIQGSNTIIAIKNKDGKVMWSWHLWITQPDALNTTEVTNYEGKKFDFIQEPLGLIVRSWLGSQSPRQVMVMVEQTYGPSSAKHSASFKIYQSNGEEKELRTTYYQNGRKDAFLTQDLPILQIPEENLSIASCIQNPNKVYYTKSSKYQNTDFGNINLWSMDYDGTTNGLKSIKTIYDPCPAGFKVPEGTPYTAFTTTGKSSSDMEQFNVEGNYNSGWNFNNKLENPNATVFFPMVGYRRANGGNLITDYSNYWVSQCTADKGYNLHFSETKISFFDYEWNKDFLFSIFPVAE